MDIIRLDRVCVFKKNTPVAKEGGGWADGYATLLTTRGYLRKLNGSKSNQAAEMFEDNSYELAVRYQPDLETNLRTDMRVEIDSRTYKVMTWQKQDEKNFYYIIKLSEHRA